MKFLRRDTVPCAGGELAPCVTSQITNSDVCCYHTRHCRCSSAWQNGAALSMVPNVQAENLCCFNSLAGVMIDIIMQRQVASALLEIGETVHVLHPAEKLHDWALARWAGEVERHAVSHHVASNHAARYLKMI